VLAAGLAIGAIVGLVLGLTAATSRRGASVRPAAHVAPSGGAAGGRWIASWTASPEAAPPGSAFSGGFRDQTIRNVIYTSAGGTLARVRLDNTFGSQPLVVGRAAIGVVRQGATLVPGTSLALTFAGRRSTLIPPGGQALSDPIHLTVHPLQSLAVSVFVPQPTGPPTQHDDAEEPNYVVAGDHVLAGGPPSFALPLDSWYLVSGLDVWAPGHGHAAVVALGDSITNGDGTVSGANARWPNDLERRLYARPGGSLLSVVDAGIDGNRVLNPSPCCGQSALARFGRDVLSQAGVREVIVLEGINDIGFGSSSPLAVPRVAVSAQQIIAGYEQLIAHAHAAGLKIFGATLTPFKRSQTWTPAREATRDAVNAWIRHSGAFDGVIDFARAVADPRDRQRLDPRYDYGDHLHMDDAGYQAMADAINLAMLLR
jgi:lysophospholipase L1-like esterase